MSERAVSRILCLAMAAPPLTWFAYEQGMGAMQRVACDRGGGWTGVACGVLAAALCIAAALCARLGPTPDAAQPRRETVRLLRILTVSSALLFGLAIVYQTAATVIIPPCIR